MSIECDACGSDDVKKRFVAERSLIDSSSTRRIENEFIRCSEYDFFYKLTAEKDFLMCTCNECGKSFNRNVNSDNKE